MLAYIAYMDPMGNGKYHHFRKLPETLVLINY